VPRSFYHGRTCVACQFANLPCTSIAIASPSPYSSFYIRDTEKKGASHSSPAKTKSNSVSPNCQRQFIPPCQQKKADWLETSKSSSLTSEVLQKRRQEREWQPKEAQLSTEFNTTTSPIDAENTRRRKSAAAPRIPYKKPIVLENGAKIAQSPVHPSSPVKVTTQSQRPPPFRAPRRTLVDVSTMTEKKCDVNKAVYLTDELKDPSLAELTEQMCRADRKIEVMREDLEVLKQAKKLAEEEAYQSKKNALVLSLTLVYIEDQKNEEVQKVGDLEGKVDNLKQQNQKSRESIRGNKDVILLLQDDVRGKNEAIIELENTIARQGEDMKEKDNMISLMEERDNSPSTECTLVESRMDTEEQQSFSKTTTQEDNDPLSQAARVKAMLLRNEAEQDRFKAEHVQLSQELMEVLQTEMSRIGSRQASQQLKRGSSIHDSSSASQSHKRSRCE
jgi:hypothetical protein